MERENAGSMLRDKGAIIIFRCVCTEDSYETIVGKLVKICSLRVRVKTLVVFWLSEARFALYFSEKRINVEENRHIKRGVSTTKQNRKNTMIIKAKQK